MNICILTEGGENIGFGHLSRCLALTQGIRKINKKAKIEFIINQDINAAKFLRRQNLRPISFNWLEKRKKAVSLSRQADIVVIDSYLAPAAFYSEFGKGKHNPYVVAIDDYNRIKYDADIVITPSLSYGTILRKEFWELPKKKIKKNIMEILITFGGKDYGNFMDNFVRKLSKKFPYFSYHILSPKRNFSWDRYLEYLKIKVYSNLYGQDMRNLMLKCDVCISGGGQTLYELARCGVPTIGICFARNQMPNLEKWRGLGFLEFVGWYNSKNIVKKVTNSLNKIDFKTRRKMSQIGRRCIDGRGAIRIANEILTCAKGQ